MFTLFSKYVDIHILCNPNSESMIIKAVPGQNMM